MSWIIGFLVRALVIFVCARLLPGVDIKNYGTAILTAILISVINIVTAPIAGILHVMVAIISIGLLNGLLSFLLNVVILRITDWILPGLKIHSWLNTIIFALAISIVNGFVATAF